MLFQTLQTVDSLDICSQKSSSKFATLGSLSKQDFLLLSTSQKDALPMIEFHHMDSLINYSSNLNSLTVPNDVRAYETVRNGYMIMLNNPWILFS